MNVPAVRAVPHLLLLWSVALWVGCSGSRRDPCLESGECNGPVRINEVMPENAGAWLDEAWETDDYLEVINVSDAPVDLTRFRIGDRPDRTHLLPAVTLAPGQVLLLWADKQAEQGENHLPFTLSADNGETLYLVRPDGLLADKLTLPGRCADCFRNKISDVSNLAYARIPDGAPEISQCRWATPGKPNGASCGRPVAPPPQARQFAPYPWGPPPELSGLHVTELALRPAAFVEVRNGTTGEVDLGGYQLRLAPHAPWQPWPGPQEGAALAWPQSSLAPGERLVVPVAEGDVAAIAATAHYEGVLSLWATGEQKPRQRVDFMAWPQGAVLARSADSMGRFRFCTGESPGEPEDTCAPVFERPSAAYLRHLRSGADFDALAETAVGQSAVKFVIDMEAGDTVYFLGRDWWIHYAFIREMIERKAHLDRCDPDQNREFIAGWGAFSQAHYAPGAVQRFLLGTLIHHVGADLRTVEFFPTDPISGAHMKRAFFAVAEHLDQPTLWAVRHDGAEQLDKLLPLEGQLPLVSQDAPFLGLRVQLMNPGVAYGELQFVPVDQLIHTPLGPQIIAVTDQVPNDIQLVGGLITSDFQTPLSHVSLLSRNRNTPNMSLKDAIEDPRVKPFLNKLVRFEVTNSGFDLRIADPAEVAAFHEARSGNEPPAEPRIDLTVRGLQPLTLHGMASTPAIGGKAASTAYLRSQTLSDLIQQTCPTDRYAPPDPFAIPVVHSVEHYLASGARALLREHEAKDEFKGDPRARGRMLEEVRQKILSHPIDPVLLAEVEGYIREKFGWTRMRFRSSSNVEDIKGFSGAGLYASTSAELDNAELSIQDAIRAVWASLYDSRAYDERTFFNIGGENVAMGVLVHPTSRGEKAQGIGLTADIFDPAKPNVYTLNAQLGEATVTNPAPGVTTDLFLYRPYETPRSKYYGRSSLAAAINQGRDVLTGTDVDRVTCSMDVIHNAYRQWYDPEHKNPIFALDIEFKIFVINNRRHLYIKQARPYGFGNVEVPADCRGL